LNKLQALSTLSILISHEFTEECTSRGIIAVIDTLTKGVTRGGMEIAYGRAYVGQFIESKGTPKEIKFSEYMNYCELQSEINIEFNNYKHEIK
jgi:hypothetical protein